MRQKFSITACMFGILNLVLLVLATRQIGYSWAFFHPDHPIAQHLHAQARPYVIDNVFSLNEENWTDPLNVFYDERAWECVDQNEYGCIFWNEGLKLTARPMLVSQCYSPELIRKNWAALIDRPFPENHSNTLIEYVYFDSQNRWIRPPGFLRPRTHELQQHLASHQLDESTPGWWLMQDLLYEQYLEREKAEAEKLRPYTRREIDMLVARNWGDERPVWWQDE
ncbi:hypothetical protein [Henriciella sp.]|uniref:hypothetical protein n=1 Tax=Henriciella sp. TaxID=1968823 RepID=UPI00263378B0|nr:hypothetical protein [Henriciella sp.]